MRVKPNRSARVVTSHHHGENNLYTRFSVYFDELLAETHQDARPDRAAAYVQNEPVALQLKTLLTGNSWSHIRFFVGRTGVGKSTYIRHELVGRNNPVIHTRPDGDAVLVIPMFLNATTLELDQEHVPAFRQQIARFINGKIESAIDLVMHTYSLDLKEEDIAAFVRSHKVELLFRDSDVPRGSSDVERLAALRRSEPYAYMAECLKYVAQRSPVRRLLVVVDDVEAHDHQIQVHLFKRLMQLQDCLKNLGEEQATFSSAVLACCRPETRRLLTKDRTFSAYSVGDDITIDRIVPIADIFEARFQAVVSDKGAGKTRSHQVVSNLDAWREARSVLDRVSQRLDKLMGQRLLEVCNLNYRQTMRVFISILTNDKWCQLRSAGADGSFTVDDRHYKIDDTTVLRAVALGPGDVFLNSPDVPITNVLRNDEAPWTDGAMPMLLAYFCRRSRLDSAPMPELKGHVIEKMKSFFPQNGHIDFVGESIDYMVGRGLLEEDVTAEGTHLTATPRLLAHYDLLGQTSNLLEFCRDDAYLPPSSKVSATTSVNLRDADLFTGLLEYWGQLAAAEERAWSRVSANEEVLETLKDDFGTSIVSYQAIRGIGSSFHRYTNGVYPKPEWVDQVARDIETGRQRARRLAQKVAS